MKKPFKIWYEKDKTHAEFLQEITELNKYDPDIEKVKTGKNFPDNPDTLQKIIYLDMPDVIVTYGFPERTVLGVEFSAEAPSGHDIFQRLARVSAAAEFSTPFAFLFPEKKFIIREKSERWDLYNPLSLKALVNIARFHRIPILSFFWRASQLTGERSNGYLICDEKYKNLPDREDEEIKEFVDFVNLIISYTIENKKFVEAIFDPFYIERETKMWASFHNRMQEKKDLFQWSPLTSCEVVSTQDMLNNLKKEINIEIKLPTHVINRKETLIYKPDVTTFRADPYAGSLIGIDYLTCRNGPSVRHRYRNLAMHFKNVDFHEMKKMYSRYYERCPFNPNYKEIDRYLTLHLKDGCRYTKQKELRIYCYISDLLIFSDAVLY